METTHHLTCTCSARYTTYSDHDADCDLWLIDEFWAGFLAWDPDREVLVMTSTHPDPENSVATIWGDADSLEFPEEISEQELVQSKLEEMDSRDRDIALTTDAFIERMLNKYPQDDGQVWSKDADDNWVASAAPTVVHTPNGGTYSYGAKASYGDWDNYDWTTLSDRHCETKVPFPSGLGEVQCTSLSESGKRKGDDPDFSLYLTNAWMPHGISTFIPWQDYGTPEVSYEFADYAIREAYNWAKAGAVVEVGCIGAHGRTGTVLACMMVLDDEEMTADQAITYVRAIYCTHAVESRIQEWYVARFHANHHDLPIPERPINPPPAPVVLTTPQGTTTDNTTPKVLGTPESLSDGPAPLGDPTRKNKRFKRRGGKRVKRMASHRNRMNSR